MSLTGKYCLGCWSLPVQRCLPAHGDVTRFSARRRAPVPLPRGPVRFIGCCLLSPPSQGRSATRVVSERGYRGIKCPVRRVTVQELLQRTAREERVTRATASCGHWSVPSPTALTRAVANVSVLMVETRLQRSRDVRAWLCISMGSQTCSLTFRPSGQRLVHPGQHSPRQAEPYETTSLSGGHHTHLSAGYVLIFTAGDIGFKTTLKTNAKGEVPLLLYRRQQVTSGFG